MGASTGGGTGETGTVLAEINVTPFVDVMLVLLVIFMITTPMMHEMVDQHSEVEMDLPVAPDEDRRIQLEDIDQVILSIDEDLQIYFGNEPLVDCGPYRDDDGLNPFEPCFDELQTKVENNHRLQEDGRVYLLAHADIPYGIVVGSMNRIRLAGVTRVGMVTNPEFRTDSGEQ